MSLAHQMITPDIGSPHRRIFEHAFQHEDMGQMAAISVDSQIDKALRLGQRQIESNASPDEIMTSLAPMIDTLTEYSTAQLEAIRASNDPDTITVVHLALVTEAMEAQVMWPLLAAYGRDNREAKTHRLRIAYDMYGVYGQQLETLLETGHWEDFAYDTGHLMGALQEVTALALLNRQPSSNRIALHSSAKRDKLGTDIDMFNFHHGPDFVSRKKIQVKTRGHLHNPGTVLLTAQDLGNIDRNDVSTYKTARAIIAELNGMESDEATAYLDEVVKHPKLRYLTQL